MSKKSVTAASKTRIGLGLAAIGRPEYINIRQQIDDNKAESSYRKRALSLLNFAYGRNVRDFDTAASYGKGELFLKEWYKDKGHSDVRLSSKWGYTYKANWQLGYKGPHEVKEHSLKKLKEQWTFAKEMIPGLKTYQIHSATFESGVLENKEVIDELSRIKMANDIQIGISVSGANQKEVIAAAKNIMVDEKALFDSYQVTYNILDPSTHDILRLLLKQGKEVIIKEAMANGRLIPSENFQHYTELFSKLRQFSSKYHVEPDAVALRYVIDNLQPTVVLSGASSVGQLESNLKSLDFRLNDQELLTLNGFAVDPESYWSERKQLKWN